jgi:hypothetical protein
MCRGHVTFCNPVYWSPKQVFGLMLIWAISLYLYHCAILKHMYQAWLYYVNCCYYFMNTAKCNGNPTLRFELGLCIRGCSEHLCCIERNDRSKWCVVKLLYGYIFITWSEVFLQYFAKVQLLLKFCLVLFMEPVESPISCCSLTTSFLLDSL